MRAAPSRRRFTPRTRIGLAVLPLVNRLATPREALSAVVEGVALRLAPAGIRPCPAAPAPDAMEIVFGLGGDDRVALRLPAAILDRLVRAVQADLATVPAGPLLVELALAPLLDAAERIAWTGLHVVALAAPASRPGAVTLLLDGALGDADFAAELDLDPSGEEGRAAVLALVEALPAQPASLADLPVPVAAVAGHTRLTLRHLAGLAPGDVVLPDLWHLDRGEIRLVLGTGHAATADRHGATLTTPFRPIPAGGEGTGDTTMAQGTRKAGAPAMGGEAELDAVGVTLAFELGRRTVTVGELRGIGPGHVFDLGLAPDEAVDLVANGARIGRGEIVKLGERLGVRVVRLFGQDRGA
ncbi:type III secretion system cytoplasmic ring protein SctQ [Methylobacterium sp. J-076]|uniref:type III secretion system cytoplasmic ring protein SctQ n=1 Tax=Methylobacterium sp. J-076 TaxID=2836655 RepID=UPI001FBABDE0|nr:type III secretion system cytoplasmic ring protein SctQ [Methylobacterium sp. J-076]MCJ2013130.1 type III secretion system cytoplasmic ring protein SctQ [Methylobacterium sp. J-076]